MNRPIVTDYVDYLKTDKDGKYATKIVDFVQDLNKYCDELEKGYEKVNLNFIKVEKQMDDVEERNEQLEVENAKLDIALTKAVEMIVCNKPLIVDYGDDLINMIRLKKDLLGE